MRKIKAIDWQKTQFQLFLQISMRMHYQKDIRMVEIIQDLFQIKKSAAYNKIRSDSPLKMEELLLLLDHFDIRLHTIISYKKEDKENSLLLLPGVLNLSSG